ncbi:Nif3-like dinuclear metal center hexameric protein [Staphylococcus massiliensis]|uniref:GTP cyclohydrolase 1 type 2 homolog n=1 Tax=Staphylococcus massiliensis S46 TaxID=1229783 RepID=K9ARM2_9STAP|nr:Nif3-like dinuclear metal center hexameric protein [Staphylococcus massiliensis]EKU49899.1 hypothetical protein C273_03355 [Staphylococcus massiliensis S46]
MIVKELLSKIETHVPFYTAKSWDNVGLLIGDASQEVNRIMTCLDCTLEVVDEAIEAKVDTIVAHHPLIFKGVKSITEDGYGTIIRKLIKHDINLIALHTNLDVYEKGVNHMLASKLGLSDVKILNPQYEDYYKVQVFIPKENADDFKEALSKEGIAKDGDYEYCFFQVEGNGQFRPVEGADPYLGEIGKIENVNELRMEFMIQEHERMKTEQLIYKHHPYETPVFDFIRLDKEMTRGLGVIGELQEAKAVPGFVQDVKSQLDMPSVRFIGDKRASIKKVAIIGGSGIGFEYKAKALGADIFITGDIKHHEALDAKINGMNLLDINHYSEYVMKDGLKALLEDWLGKESSVSIVASTLNTDPYDYM